jgi:hypothetical protein
MAKVRVGHEDIFIAHVAEADNLTGKNHFNFNHKWGVNNSDTKQIVERKIKSYLMNLITEVEFAIDDYKGTQQHTMIGHQPITDLLIYIGREIDKFIDR